MIARTRSKTLDSLANVPLQWKKWRELPQDMELWLEEGDCLVHLYSHNKSHRESRLRLTYADVEALQSTFLLETCRHQRPGHAIITDESEDVPDNIEYELYVPAPVGLSGEDEYRFHLITRNCMAFASSRPLVGYKLGDAIMDVWDRLQEWHCEAELKDMVMSYCAELDYSTFAEHPDRALACLKLAEHARMKDLWIEAFTHCVGMQERLQFNHEYSGLRASTKSLIATTSQEMLQRMERAFDAVGSFLEEELGPEHLGLTNPARDHLDRFRSCINNYYVEKLGYFPPHKNHRWNKQLWAKMYDSFRSLYEYLVDNDSSTDPFNTRGLNGGVCVAQNVQAFDLRYGCTPLDHPLPLLPEESIKRRRTLDTPKGLRSFKLNRSNTLLEPKKAASTQALEQATNPLDANTAVCPFVQEYQWFERQKIEEKICTSEARKVRWLLIYGVLQMLISIIRAPQEVRNPHKASYPLCIDAARCLPWNDNQEPETTRSLMDTAKMVVEPCSSDEEETDRISIHPDCEADCAEDYFAGHNGLSRKPSELSFNRGSRVTSQPLSRSASIRSSVSLSVTAIQRSVVGSLTRRHNSKRKSAPPPRSATYPEPTDSYRQIVVQGYGNGSYTDGSNNTSFSPNEMPDEIYELSAESPSAIKQFDFALDMVCEEPVELSDRSPPDSDLSATSSQCSNSKRSSCHDDYCTPSSEYSISWDDSDLTHNGDNTAEHGSSPSQEEMYILQQHKRIGTGPSTKVDCYQPTGYSRMEYGPPKERILRGDSIHSCASSLYEEANTQAAEIEENELRGRRRARALDMLSESEMLAQGRGIAIAG
ncbi:Hypothetical protein R9X50_00398100 [Acrodontium crateriforme]|uniref:DUF8004 domain-containing protein n=1 Tax=Acrodontium crateriforme TaxID=150365 RepID=A0AAQ3R4P8_9PEZI|nr:Hypothetical protein R9X50_00398100 [Acrodontium crateriforme]